MAWDLEIIPLYGDDYFSHEHIFAHPQHFYVFLLWGNWMNETNYDISRNLVKVWRMINVSVAVAVVVWWCFYYCNSFFRFSRSEYLGQETSLSPHHR